MSPDPIHIMTRKITDPQQWNMYSYVRNNPLRFLDPKGLYICTGSKEQCTVIRTALDNLQKAASNLKEGSKERQALDKILGFYGSEGVKNGVNVKFGDLQGKAEAQTRPSSLLGFRKSTTITFDLSRMQQDFGNRNDGVDRDTEFAAVAAHEGAHGLYGGEHKSDRTLEDLKANEKNSFTQQSYVNQGLNKLSSFGLWSPSWTPLEQEFFQPLNIDKAADDAAKVDCEVNKCQ
jgi:uncharacterized protein RhaS with RHS repeats